VYLGTEHSLEVPYMYMHSWASLNQNLTALNVNCKQLFKI
jgi:hypothetical protein